MRTLSDSRLLQRESENLSAEFVQIELDLAITFCETALRSIGDRSQRNLRHARIAFSSAQRFTSRIGIQDKDYQATWKEKVERLAILFDKLKPNR